MSELRAGAVVDLSIIIVNWNTRDLLLQCLQSIYDTVHDLELEVIVVDNGSTDGSAQAVRRDFPRVQVIANARNEGFARANTLHAPVFDEVFRRSMHFVTAGWGMAPPDLPVGVWCASLSARGRREAGFCSRFCSLSLSLSPRPFPLSAPPCLAASMCIGD